MEEAISMTCTAASHQVEIPLASSLLGSCSFTCLYIQSMVQVVSFSHFLSLLPALSFHSGYLSRTISRPETSHSPPDCRWLIPDVFYLDLHPAGVPASLSIFLPCDHDVLLLSVSKCVILSPGGFGILLHDTLSHFYPWKPYRRTLMSISSSVQTP